MLGDIIRTVAVGQVGGAVMMAYKAYQVMRIHGWRWALYGAARWLWYGVFGGLAWSVFSLALPGVMVAVALLFGLPVLRAVLFAGLVPSLSGEEES